MVSHMVITTLQAAGLSAISNLAAQGIKAYREERRFTLKPYPLLQFILFTLVSCPPNILWQSYLEAKFPGYTLQPSSSTTTIYEKQLSIPNTFRKFLFDQTLGAFVNTIAFVAAMSAFKGKRPSEVQREVERDAIPLMISGWKVWPVVAFCNFAFVPVESRIIVGSVVGLFWGVYLSMFAAVD